MTHAGLGKQLFGRLDRLENQCVQQSLAVDADTVHCCCAICMWAGSHQQPWLCLTARTESCVAWLLWKFLFVPQLMPIRVAAGRTGSGLSSRAVFPLPVLTSDSTLLWILHWKLRVFRLEKCFRMPLSGEHLFCQGKAPSSILV